MFQTKNESASVPLFSLEKPENSGELFLWAAGHSLNTLFSNRFVNALMSCTQPPTVYDIFNNLLVDKIAQFFLLFW